MATAEDRLKMMIGDLVFQNTFLAAKLEEAQAELQKLEPSKDEPKKPPLRPVR